MKYKDAQELAAGLREFADFVEKYGPQMGVDIEVPYISCYVYDKVKWGRLEDGTYGSTVLETAKDRFARATKVLVRARGTAEKKWTSYALKVSTDFGPIEFEMDVSREQVCRRVVVGTEEVPEKVVPAHTKEISEWVCEDSSILAMVNE